MLVTDLIAEDHRNFQRLFAELEEAKPPARENLERLLEELDAHARAEEAVFYPAVRQTSRRIDDAEAGHEHMRELIQATVAATAGSPEFADALLRLKAAVLNHAVEEEGGVFLDAARLGLEKLESLGRQMEEHKRTARASRRRAA
jgi:hemerythrin superfamily protein